MPIVALELTEEETARVDSIAEAEKRARKNQAHILLLDGLRQAESEKLEAETAKVP
jgi:hypothetical protein